MFPPHPAASRPHATETAAALREAHARNPRDAGIAARLGMALAGQGDAEGAAAAFARACELDPASAGHWYNLGRLLRGQARVEESLAPLARALALDPRLESAHFLRAEALMMLGRSAEAAAQYRALLAFAPASGLAWWGLANLKSERFEEADAAALRALQERPGLAPDERIAAAFAFAKALDDLDRPAEAYAAWLRANGLARPRFRWDAAGFGNWTHDLLQRFAQLRMEPVDPGLGREVIFVVGMPRSASTLTEQILAAHPQVEGGSELADLGAVLGEESRRRGQPFPAWVGAASAADWRRLGRRYLERTARWRATRPRFTDKMPSNWMLVGAIRAMLPGARIVDCRRDALETCWSCFRQIFWSVHGYSYDFEDLADYRARYLAAMRQWQELPGAPIRSQGYEALLADPEGETRALLDACGLSFDPACLRFFEAGRSVRTASAAQVREPLRRDTARAPRYGALLDPLREALARHGAA